MAAIIGVYKSLNITIGSAMKILEILKLVCDHLRTKNIYISLQLKNYLSY